MSRDNIAPTGASRHSPSQPGKRLGFAAYLIAGIPFFAVSFGVCFANRDEPVLFGFPFLLDVFDLLDLCYAALSLAGGPERTSHRFDGFAAFPLLDRHGEVAADFWHQRRTFSSGA